MSQSASGTNLCTCMDDEMSIRSSLFCRWLLMSQSTPRTNLSKCMDDEVSIGSSLFSKLLLMNFSRKCLSAEGVKQEHQYFHESGEGHEQRISTAVHTNCAVHTPCIQKNQKQAGSNWCFSDFIIELRKHFPLVIEQIYGASKH